MVRSARRVDENGLNKGTWTPEEDQKLIAYVTRYGCWNWRQLPRFAGLSRCGKSCRLRWMNYLSPNIKRGNYTQEEEESIIKLHEKLGNRWSAIAAQLPGRTDSDIKNYWNTKLSNQNPTYEKHNHSQTHLEDLTNQNQTPSAEGWSGWLADCSDYSVTSNHASSSSASTINWFNEDFVVSSETFDED